MAYEIQALLLQTQAHVAFDALHPHAPTIALTADLWLAPLTPDVSARLGSAALVLPVGDEGEFDGLTEGVLTTLAVVSRSSSAAFIGAESFGGPVAQWGVIYRDGELVGAPASRSGFINEALRALGVQASSRVDEFDEVELGRFRSTESWLQAALL